MLLVGMAHDSSLKRNIVLAVPRVGLALVLGVVIATPLTLQVFHREIDTQIVALQGALASLRGGHDALAEVAVQSLTVNRLEQVDQAPAVEDALEDEIYFVRRGDRV